MCLHYQGRDQETLKFMKSLDIIFSLRALVVSNHLSNVHSTQATCLSQRRLGMKQGRTGFVRMSIGIEDVEDLWKDIDSGLNSAKKMMIEMT